jgi:hypothetical protein
VKLHEHLNHIAGRAGTSKNGQDLRSRTEQEKQFLSVKRADVKQILEMKIKISFASFIVLIGLGAFLVSCKKDEDTKETKLPTCRCTVEYTYYDGSNYSSDSESFTVDLSDEDDMDEWFLEVGEIKTCKELEDPIEDEYSSDMSPYASCK